MSTPPRSSPFPVLPIDKAPRTRMDSIAVRQSRIEGIQEDSPLFRTELDKLERKITETQKSFHTLVKISKQTVTVGKQSSAIGTEFATEILRLSKDQAGGGVHGEDAERIASVLKQTEHVKTLLGMSMEGLFTAPMEQFVNEEFRELIERKKIFDKHRGAYHHALQQLQKHSTKKDKGAKREALEKALNEAKKNYELASVDYVAKLNELETGSRLQFLEHLNGYMYSLMSFFQEGYDMFKELEPFLADMDSKVRAAKKSMEHEAALTRLQRQGVEERDTGSPAKTKPKDQDGDAEPEKQGYLFKQSRSLSRKWMQRWFVVKGGVMYYYRSGKDLNPQGTINLLFSSVKPALKASRDHCFQVLTNKNREYVLQCESEAEMMEWMTAIQNSTAMLLDAMKADKPNAERTTALEASKDSSGLKPLDRLREDESNRTCADCGAPNPEWASINLGVVVCIECSGIHRHLGTHISKVRSAKLDTEAWDSDLLNLMLSIGNARANQVWELDVPGDKTRPSPEDDLSVKDAWVTAKYQERAFVGLHSGQGDTPFMDNERLGQCMYEAAEREDIPSMYRLRVQGADINWQNPEHQNRTPLHLAADSGNTVVANFILNNSGSVDVVDEVNSTPLHLATKNNHVEMVKLLLRNKADIEKKDSRGDTALDVAMASNDLKESEELLLMVKMEKVRLLMEETNQERESSRKGNVADEMLV